MPSAQLAWSTALVLSLFSLGCAGTPVATDAGSDSSNIIIEDGGGSDAALDAGHDAAVVDDAGTDAAVTTDTGAGDAGSAAAALCLSTGGTVSSALCCGSAGDFPSSCLTGACGCSPSSSHTVAVCQCAGGNCFDPAVGCTGP